MIRNNRGSTSVLVILVIIVLATFGGVAVTSSWTNKKLAMKSVAWNEEYCLQEQKAEYMTARIDAILLEAQNKTLEYFSEGDFAQGKQPSGVMPSLVSEDFLNSFEDNESKTERILAVRTIYRRLYYYYAAVKLQELAADTGIEVIVANDDAGWFLNTGAAAPMAGDLTVAFTVSAGDQPGDLFLNVGMEILAPEYDLDIGDGTKWQYSVLFKPLNGSVRYRITDWSTGQVPMQVSQDQSSPFDGSIG